MSDPQDATEFVVVKSTFAGKATNGSVFSVAANELNIGAAAASNCVIGCRPRISSIVRNMLEVEYIVESTPRWRE